MAVPANNSRLNVAGLPAWSVVFPPLALALLLLGKPAGLLSIVMALAMGGAIITAVYHAEIIAHRTGEPFGTLILALAVTTIETSLIVSIMLSDAANAQTLARDTVIAAAMITLNGIVGLCLLAGARRHHEQSFTQSGVSYGLAMVATLAVLTLVLPNYTTTVPGPFYDTKQLIFAAVVSLILYATFVGAQTIRHRDHFVHEVKGARWDADALPPSDHDMGSVDNRMAIVSAGLLVVALIAVVLLAKALSPTIEAGVISIGAPQATVGIIIAVLVLAPEGVAALRAARVNEVQRSLNLAIGSAVATIGLTIPAVAVASLIMDLDLALGLSAKLTVLLGLTLLVSTITLGTGRTTFLQGVVHLVIFATYLFTTLVP